MLSWGLDASMLTGAVTAISILIAFRSVIVQRQQAAIAEARLVAEAYRTLYTLSIEMTKFFAAYPGVRPYFYDEARIEDAQAETKHRAESIALHILDMMEFLNQVGGSRIDPGIRDSWFVWFDDMKRTAPVLRDQLSRYERWYSLLSDR